MDNRYKKWIVCAGFVFFTLLCISCVTSDTAAADESAEVSDHSISQTAVPSGSDAGIAPAKKRTEASVAQSKLASLRHTHFCEVWGYVRAGSEDSYKPEYPVTDIGYFSAGLNTFGELIDVPSRKRIKNASARIHFVVADHGRALTHFCLDPQYSVRKKLISDIVKAAKPYDGLQIDFELVSRTDREHFFSFLKELKKKIGPRKMLSVAIPARVKTLKNDPYDYAELSNIADRIIVMAYDEHWSTSEPGPVASMMWCRSVASYAKSVIPDNVLVMGLPFYGRAWADDDTAGAYRFSSIERFFRGETSKGKPLTGVQLSPVAMKDGIPVFTISRNVTYTCYFDNAQSLSERLGLYEDMSVNSVAFWCLGQEDPDIWPLLHVQRTPQ